MRNPLPSDLVSSPTKDTQAKSKNGKVIKYSNLAPTLPRGTVEEKLASEEG